MGSNIYLDLHSYTYKIKYIHTHIKTKMYRIRHK